MNRRTLIILFLIIGSIFSLACSINALVEQAFCDWSGGTIVYAHEYDDYGYCVEKTDTPTPTEEPTPDADTPAEEMETDADAPEEEAEPDTDTTEIETEPDVEGEGQEDDTSEIAPEPVPGMAGNWAYHSQSDNSDQLFYVMTIQWDGQSYMLTDCVYYVEGGSCEVKNHSWDGVTFSFTLHFPHTGFTTQSTITGVSGDTLSGSRYNDQFGAGETTWRRSK